MQTMFYVPHDKAMFTKAFTEKESMRSPKRIKRNQP
jgi:hypothetical protein